ncbi:MAG: ribosome-associated protein [Siphoviridae sp. ctjeG17]|nr:MAG: ribosome-associated protein [Siphoviridae sp. ctjeG17]
MAMQQILFSRQFDKQLVKFQRKCACCRTTFCATHKNVLYCSSCRAKIKSS